MEASDDGTTSLSKTSVEKVVAALLDGRRVSVCGAASRNDIAVDHHHYAPYATTSLLLSLPCSNIKFIACKQYCNLFVMTIFRLCWLLSCFVGLDSLLVMACLR